VPTRILEFKPVESDSTLTISPVTTFPLHCTSDGALFLDMLNVEDLHKHTVISIRDKKTQTYSPTAIPDLHDIHVFDFFPSDSAVSFLVRASKEPPGAQGPGKSSSGILWNKYHNFIATFDRSGSYKGSIELPMDYTLSHLAVFPSGNYLVSGYDRLNSALRVLFLNSSGEIVHTLDVEAARKDSSGNTAFGSGDSMMASSKLLGSVLFTAYNQDIIVWRRNSNDAILDVGPGGSVHEVPLQTPPESVFVDMIPSNDRWVAHFRSRSTVEDSPMNQSDYSYYELQPQDASLSRKLMQTGVVPLSLACESDGTYFSFIRDKDNKLVMLKAD
jgi:hypothetical protein